MASNVTASGQAFQGFIVPESGLTFEYSGTTANLEPSAVTLASGSAETGLALVASGTPTMAAGNELYLYPQRTGAPGPLGAGYMWQEAATYSAAVSAGKWRGWDSPSLLRYSEALETSGVTTGASVAALPDDTAWAFWQQTTGGNDNLRYSTFNGATWAAAATLVSRTSTAVDWNPAVVALADGSIVVFTTRLIASGLAQVDVYRSSGSNTLGVLPAAFNIRDNIRSMLAARDGDAILLLIQTSLNSGPVYYTLQYVSYDGGVSFVAVSNTEAANSEFVASSIASTPSGLVILGDKRSASTTFTAAVKRLGVPSVPLSSVSSTLLWSARTRSSGLNDTSGWAVYDPSGAVHVFRESSNPATYAADQAVSVDGGATWQEYGGGSWASGARGWVSIRESTGYVTARAAWSRDRALVVATAGAQVLAWHMGGAAERPMPAAYVDTVGSGGTYGARPLWSASWTPIAEAVPDDMGWTTSDTGTIGRVFNPGYMTETVQTGETSSHRLEQANSGGEVIGRWVIGGEVSGTLDCRMLVQSGNGSAFRSVEVTRIGSAWTYSEGGGSNVSLGTYASTPAEVIIAVSHLSGRARIIVRAWADPSDPADEVFDVSIAATSTAGSNESACSWRAYLPSAASVSVDLWGMDAAFTSATGVLAASTEPRIEPRPLSSEVPIYVGGGLSFLMFGQTIGAARFGVAVASSTGAPNLDPVSVPSPQRYFGTNDATYTQTITISRTEGYRTGWDSDLYGLHFEGIDGFESLSIELLDPSDGENPDVWRSLGTFFASSESLNWSRRGTTFAPRESSSAGNTLWLDRNELVNGALRIGSDFAYPIAENSSGTWVAGSTIAERRPFIRIDTQGETDELIGAATSGTGAYIRYPNLTVLFQPAVVAASVSGLAQGFSKVRVTIAVNGASTDGGFWLGWPAFPGGTRMTRVIRKIAMGPVVVMPRELTRAQPLSEEPRTERVAYPDGAITVTRRGPRSSRIELAYSHSHAPMRYDRWGAAATAPDYLQASGSGARPLATAEDVVGVLRGLWTDADDGAKPLVWVPYIASSASTWTLTGQGAGVYGMVSGSYQRRNAVGRPNFAAEGTVEAFTFERLTWERE
jgi:hypothetical protein